MKTPYKGSLDPFQDISEQLEKMGVAFCLMVGMASDPVTHVWCNVAMWGEGGIDNFDNAWDKEKQIQIERGRDS